MGKNEIIEQMLKFWKEEEVNAYNYPSIDFRYKDGSSLKMFINVRDFGGIEYAGVAVTYVGEEKTIETPTFIPSFRKSLKSDLNAILDQFASEGVNLEKEMV